MGADLYIKKDSNEVTGYFRDSYNVTNIMNAMGLSYWQMDKERSIGKINSSLSVKQVKALLELVKSKKSELDKFINQLSEKWLKEHYASIDDEGVVGWKTYYIEKYDRLVKFLNHAIELNSEIRWSV